MTRFLRALALLFSLSIGTLRAVSAIAAEPVRGPASEPGRTPLSIVDIEVEGTPAAVDRLRSSVIELFGRLGVSARVRAEDSVFPGADGPVLARAYVDLERAAPPRVVVVDGASQRELARRTLPASDSLETSVEAVSLVLYLVIEAKLSERAEAASAEGPRASEGSTSAPPTRAPETTRTEQSSPARPTPVNQPPVAGVEQDDANVESSQQSSSGPSAIGVDAGALLRVGTLDGERTVTGAGIALEARAERLNPRLGALFFAAAHLPTELVSGAARAELGLVSLRLIPTVAFDVSSSLSGSLGLGAGIDWLRADPDVALPARGNSVSLADATLSALAGVRWGLARPLIATAALSFDLDWSPRTFSVAVGNERRTLLELDRFRPSLLLGLALSSDGWSTKSKQSPARTEEGRP